MLTPVHLQYVSSQLSWTLTSDKEQITQASYQVQFSCSDTFDKLLWDSQTVSDMSSVCVPYGGPPLPPGEEICWRVRVIDNAGEESGWSETAQFINGLAPGDWQARFITPDTDEDAAQSAGKLLRRTFSLDGEVARAIVYVTALGLYELHINGVRVGEDLLTPGWTEYNKRLLHQSYDVTPLLRKGDNAVGAMLGAGWYKGDLAGWIGRRNIYGRHTALLMQMTVRLTDGREVCVFSDADWRCSDGPVLYAELYHGESYDARLARAGWNTADYDDVGWTPVRVMEHTTDTVTPQDGPTVRRQEVLPVQSLICTPAGENVLDFGQNIAGWVRFRVNGQAGQRVVLRHAEVLDRDGLFYTANMRSARNEIVYTLKGDGEEVFEPHFTFQGFRYVQVVEFPQTIEPEQFEAVVIHSAMERTGWFSCSDERLNQLHHNILWGLKGNFVDVCTDCPQRDERLGWTGDAQVFARTATYLMDTRIFFQKWLRDLRAAQYENGGVPFVVPDVLSGQFPPGDVISNADPVTGWGDAAVINPWTVYVAYGDKGLLAECYESMKAWVEYIRTLATDGLLWNTGFQLGDWVALDAKEGSYYGATATDLIATAYYAHVTRLLSRAAHVLGNEEDASHYAALRTDIGAAYADEFFSRTGRLVSPTQTAHILSLAFDLTPEAFKPRIVKDLLSLLDASNGHLTTGFLGTPYFCQVLADNGCLREAYELLLKDDYPSWLYQITKGATTVWEHWDGIKPDGSMWSADMNSFNHYAYGSVGEFLYRVIAGIDTDPEQVGYRKLVIRPRPGGGLTHASAAVMTPYGRAESSWRIDGSEHFRLNVTVPHNTTAAVTLPDGAQHVVGSGRYDFTCTLSH